MKVKWLKSITDKHLSIESEERSTILDAGCGGGTLIHELEKIYKTDRYYGIELNKNYADLARRMTGAEIINAPYVAGTYDFEFDIIISAKVLEHVNEPMFFLEQISNDLKDTGLTFIEVPDIQDIWTLPSNHERFWIPHLWYFSASSLNALAGLVGLTPIASRSIVTDRGRSYLQSVFRKVSHPIIIEKPFDDPKKLLKRSMYNKSQETIDLDIQSVKWNHSGIRENFAGNTIAPELISIRDELLCSLPSLLRANIALNNQAAISYFVQMGNM